LSLAGQFPFSSAIETELVPFHDNRRAVTVRPASDNKEQGTKARGEAETEQERNKRKIQDRCNNNGEM